MSKELIERLQKLSRVGFGYDLTFKDKEALIEAAKALSRPEAAQVRVKPLKLEGDFIHTDFGYYYHREKHIHGTSVVKRHEKSVEMGIGVAKDDDEFLSIAQADFDRRIRAALEPDTVTGWQDIATKLFCALDDIDTADDLAKDNEKLYRNLVRKAHKIRFEFQDLFDPTGDVSSFNQPPAPPTPNKEGK